MNQASHYIFNIYHYLLNLRDTMEYSIDREHGEALFNQRKTVLTQGKTENSALGNFLKNNPEQGEKIKEKLDEFVNEIYGDDSTILKVADGKVRVDHTQHIKLFDYIIGLQESIRDIIYGYLNFARNNKEDEAIITDLVELDDKLFRPVFTMLAMREFEKSFGEFQKVMSESQGKQTPQSNFIVQNEIVKLSQMIRFCHAHHHCTDNKTMDVLDQVLAVIEMTEGRRERRDNKSFKEIFDDINAKLNALVAEVEPQWKAAYQKALDEAIKMSQKAQEKEKNPA
ncbi:MAG: hypothetical protein K6C32_04765 [Bacilli bacterium]|nr:hypothetical protein [Bacilli bacterium]